MAHLRRLRARAFKLRALLARPEYRRALLRGVAAAVEHERTPLKHDYMTIMDVGANRGQFAIVASRRYPHAALICFEPQEGPRRILERVLAGHPRLRVIGTALAASAGTSVLHITQADDSSSLLPTTSLQVSAFPGTQVVEEIDVTTQRLDALVDVRDLVPPVLLKIDVQGTEIDVLRGSVGLLSGVDSVLVECSFAELYAGQALADDVIAFLHAHHFRLVDVVGPTLDVKGRVLQADLVFEGGSPRQVAVR